MDGSAAPFMAALEKTGLKAQNKARRVIKILKEIKAEEDGKFASLAPSITSQFRGTIDFEHSAIGKQSHNIHMINGNFAHELSNCRTFGFLDDVQALRKAGLALGGSLDNAIVLDHDKVMNKDGLRRPDEFIRHKLLDAVGDLFLAGATIIGAYDCYKPSHALNNALLHRMFADKSAWTYVSMDLGAVEPHATQKARMHDIVSAL
jgi:UDP-3-O-[3-hydroxymyristoyl] N-acetylglucosamine deacetylase